MCSGRPLSKNNIIRQRLGRSRTKRCIASSNSKPAKMAQDLPLHKRKMRINVLIYINLLMSDYGIATMPININPKFISCPWIANIGILGSY
jgi:hypothetical protein